MQSLQGYVDTGRAVLEMTGSDARAVLQDVVTNDVERVAPGTAVYAALLTPQGKFLFDFFLMASDGGILIDTDAGRAEALRQRLRMYCLRRDAALAARPDLSVIVLWGDDAAPDGAVPDPRDPALGWRLVTADASAVLNGIAPAEAAAYDAMRVDLCVPTSGAELVPDDTYILEAGFERLNGVDFRKGCYVGQEVTARMKHKTELRKGLVRVAVDGTAEIGTPITSGGKPAGTLFTTANGSGLAHLRLDRAGPDMQAGAARVRYPAGD